MTKQMLSEPRKRLIGMMQAINFGRVRFTVWDGAPDFDHAVRVTRTVKLAGGDNGFRAELGSVDFELRKEVIELLGQVANAANGAVATIEVKHGLPFVIEIEEELRA